MIALKPFVEADFGRFISWIVDEKMMFQFAGPAFTFPVSHQQLKQYILAENRLIYKVIETKSSRVIGHAEINNIDVSNKSARLCRILIAEEQDRNKGYGRMLIHLLLEVGFSKLNLHRIDLGVFDYNIGAIKCYEKCGFQKEGLLRDTFLIDDEYFSTYNMSILKREWNKP